MASKVDVFNFALSRVGIGRKVASPTELSEEAIQCNRWFDHCRDECLRNFPWAFARKATSLALRDETFPGWSYVYQYPSDCVFALSITTEDGLRNPMVWFDLWQERVTNQPPRIPFERALRADGQTQVILTDLAEAWLLYIARVEVTAVWDVDFVNMLAWRLAAEVALPLKAKADLAQYAANNYEAMRARAAANDFNESYPDAEPDAPSISARG